MTRPHFPGILAFVLRATVRDLACGSSTQWWGNRPGLRAHAFGPTCLFAEWNYWRSGSAIVERGRAIDCLLIVAKIRRACLPGAMPSLFGFVYEPANTG